MILEGRWGIQEVAVQQETREAAMARRVKIIMVMVVWWKIWEYVIVAESKI